MNKTNIIALFLGVSILIGFFVRNKIQKAIKELDYGVAPGIKVSDFNFDSSTLILPIWVYNPTNLKMIISNLELDCFINKLFVGKVKLDRSFAITPNGKSIVPLQIELKNTQAFQIIIDNQKYIQAGTWRDKIELSLRGSLRAESGIVYISRIPVSIDGNYKFWMG